MPKGPKELRDTLDRIDGRGYKQYKLLEGEYQFPRFTLHVDHAQGDPFASPSLIRTTTLHGLAQFPKELFSSPIRRIALEDFISRQFAIAIKKFVKGHRGTGHSGLIAVDASGQEILQRTACVVNDDSVEVRFVVGLPAFGRACAGREAAAMFLEEIPRLVESSMFYAALDTAALTRHIHTAEDQDALRRQLERLGLVAFVADGAVLPRASGISEEPMTGSNVVPFRSPPELRVEIETPNGGKITGMGIPEGVTLIVGGGYHGKSTLLHALDRGVYNHIPADGRERVVTRADAVKIRAEDGRSVEKVDISPFISNLPFQKDTTAFSTQNASGSTSQAANIIEALEYGTSLLLIDEDTSATNFMIRDARMQRLVPKPREPITPFIDQVRNLASQHKVSTVVVLGGSGDYFDVADTVIAMTNYLPSVVTTEAHNTAREIPTNRTSEAPSRFGAIIQRAAQPQSLNPYRNDRLKVSARGLRSIEFGRETIDMQDVEQLVDISQTRAIGDVLVYCLQRAYFDGEMGLKEALRRVFDDIAKYGLDAIAPHKGQHPGDYALPRLQEAAMAINRLRTLRMKHLL